MTKEGRKPANPKPSGKKRPREAKLEAEVVVCPSAFPDFTTVGGSTSRRRERERGNPAGRSGSEGFGGRGGGGDGRGAMPGGRGGGGGGGRGGAPQELDVQETIREVHKFGAEGFTGSRKKSHDNSEYERLTGRSAKRHKMPTKIVVGMRRKARKREEREKRELKESGVVSHHATPSTQGKNKNKRKDERKEFGGGAVRGAFGTNRARNTGDRRSMSARSFGPAPDVGFTKGGMLKVKHPRR
ncbi:hypothetical protein ACHAWF_004072 [Thalassiosira exigua]